MRKCIIEFFSSDFMTIIGGGSTVIMIGGFLYVCYLVIKGVFPVRYRLGLGLSKRKIAIFADSKYLELSGVLLDSGIFQKNNIKQIQQLSDIKAAEDISLLLVHRSCFKNHIDELLMIKKHGDALIIYAPQDEGRIDDHDSKKLNLESNCVIVNFRGRLLNDILVSMITTSYGKK